MKLSGQRSQYAASASKFQRTWACGFQAWVFTLYSCILCWPWTPYTVKDDLNLLILLLYLLTCTTAFSLYGPSDLSMLDQCHRAELYPQFLSLTFDQLLMNSLTLDLESQFKPDSERSLSVWFPSMLSYHCRKGIIPHRYGSCLVLSVKTNSAAREQRNVSVA